MVDLWTGNKTGHLSRAYVKKNDFRMCLGDVNCRGFLSIYENE